MNIRWYRYNMQKIIKYIANRFYKPLLTQYLSATRTYSGKGFRLVIPSGVFHPGFFFSTRLLLEYIGKRPLEGRSFLELGAGSGLISLFVSREGAKVVASDINPTAVECIRNNSQNNHVDLSVIQSDLFGDIPLQSFDIIAINPPYYKKDPQTPGEYAWYCGEHGEYFERLFSGLRSYSHPGSEIFMILCDGCDLDMVRGMAARHGFGMRCSFEKKNMVETNFIFAIERTG